MNSKFKTGKLYRVSTPDIMNSNYWVGWSERDDAVKDVICQLHFGDIVMFLEENDKAPHFKLLTEDGITAWFYHNPYFYTLEEAKK